MSNHPSASSLADDRAIADGSIGETAAQTQARVAAERHSRLATLRAVTPVTVTAHRTGGCEIRTDREANDVAIVGAVLGAVRDLGVGQRGEGKSASTGWVIELYDLRFTDVEPLIAGLRARGFVLIELIVND